MIGRPYAGLELPIGDFLKTDGSYGLIGAWSTNDDIQIGVKIWTQNQGFIHDSKKDIKPVQTENTTCSTVKDSIFIITNQNSNKQYSIELKIERDDSSTCIIAPKREQAKNDSIQRKDTTEIFKTTLSIGYEHLNYDSAEISQIYLGGFVIGDNIPWLKLYNISILSGAIFGFQSADSPPSRSAIVGIAWKSLTNMSIFAQYAPIWYLNSNKNEKSDLARCLIGSSLDY